LFGLIPLTGFIAVICALVAIPLAFAARSRVRKGAATNGKTAMSGLLLGLGALALGIWGITIVFGAVDQLADDLSGPAPVGAPAVSDQQPAAGAPAEQSTAAFGERVAFSDGLEVELSSPDAFTPSRTAAGRGERAVRITVTVRNGSTEPFEPILLTLSANHGGREAEQVFDSAKGINGSPSTSVLPGRSVTFDVVFAIGREPADLQVDVTAGFLGEPAIFTGRI
jgi:hypothetical protein